jgi:hypothetical protein
MLEASVRLWEAPHAAKPCGDEAAEVIGGAVLSRCLGIAGSGAEQRCGDVTATMRGGSYVLAGRARPVLVQERRGIDAGCEEGLRLPPTEVGAGGVDHELTLDSPSTEAGVGVQGQGYPR